MKKTYVLGGDTVSFDFNPVDPDNVSIFVQNSATVYTYKENVLVDNSNLNFKYYFFIFFFLYFGKNHFNRTRIFTLRHTSNTLFLIHGIRNRITGVR